jgi:hypothetical protein
MDGAVAGIGDPGFSKTITWDICRHHRSPLELKNHIQFRRGVRFYTQMKKNAQHSRGRRVIDFAATAIEQMKHYCAAHPGSPSAVRRPQLFFRGDLWIAQLGPSVEEGIVGIGPTVAAALRAFDAQYLADLRPPNEAISAR